MSEMTIIAFPLGVIIGLLLWIGITLRDILKELLRDR